MPITRNQALAGTAKARRRYSGGFSFLVRAGHFQAGSAFVYEFLRPSGIV
jgi:hypothetical protein